MIIEAISFKDPTITIKYAQHVFGNRANIARVLGVSRALITNWVNVHKMTHIPGVHAHRLTQLKEFEQFKV